MKRFIPLVLATLFAIPAFGQKEIKKGTVNSLKLNSNIQNWNPVWKCLSEDCFLWLYDDGTYTIELESWWEYFYNAQISLVEEAVTLHVSIGRYYWDGDKLYCKDAITNSTFDFISSNGNLITVKGLPFMNDRVFSGLSKDSHTFLDMSNAMTETKWQELNKSVKELPLRKTRYKTTLEEFRNFSIDVNQDNTYEMKYGGFLLSQGKWERNGNLLVMHDNNVGGNYHALIEDNTLTIYTLEGTPRTLYVYEDEADILVCIDGDDDYGEPLEILQDEDGVYLAVPEGPEYPEGTNALLDYMRRTQIYPDDARRKGIQGRVLVQFIIEEDGSITNPKVVKKVCPSLDAEAVRIISSMPKWKPGKIDGKPCRVRFTVPINFRLN